MKNNKKSEDIGPASMTIKCISAVMPLVERLVNYGMLPICCVIGYKVEGNEVTATFATISTGGDKEFKILADLCAEFLKSKGYAVIKPENPATP